MRTGESAGRVGYLVLGAAPIVVFPLAGARPLRIPIVHEVVGVLLFALIALAAWWVARPSGEARDAVAPLLRIAGLLLMAPIALIALLWVGLGTPWDATPTENKMRYSVLLTAAIVVTGGFFVMREALREGGERLHSTLALAMGAMSGFAYVVWTAFQLGDFALRVSTGAVNPAVASMNNVFDALLFAASALAYVATAALARSLERSGWLAAPAARWYVALNLLALVLLLLRGVSFPIPGGDPAPWYTRPGFIVGIPAMPWLMPYYLGVLALRRSGSTGPE